MSHLKRCVVSVKEKDSRQQWHVVLFFKKIITTQTLNMKDSFSSRTEFEMGSNQDHRHRKDYEVRGFICKQRHSKKRGSYKSKDSFDSLSTLGSWGGTTGVSISCLGFLNKMVKFSNRCCRVGSQVSFEVGGSIYNWTNMPCQQDFYWQDLKTKIDKADGCSVEDCILLNATIQKNWPTQDTCFPI